MMAKKINNSGTRTGPYEKLVPMKGFGKGGLNFSPFCSTMNHSWVMEMFIFIVAYALDSSGQRISYAYCSFSHYHFWLSLTIEKFYNLEVPGGAGQGYHCPYDAFGWLVCSAMNHSWVRGKIVKKKNLTTIFWICISCIIGNDGWEE